MKKQVFNFLFNNFLKVCNFLKVGQFLIFNSLIFNLYPSVFYAQKTEIDTQLISFIIEPIYGDKKIENEAIYPLQKGDSVQITMLKFYLSNVELSNGKETVWKELNSVHLMDLEDRNSFELALNVPKSIVFNSVKFNLGIDSLTNVSGALGGDLDPTKGMYWAWQSGYVNFKLEGKSKLCPTRKNIFQFHLGGYLAQNNCLQSVDIQLNKSNSDKLVLQLNIQDFLSIIDLKQQNSVMIPSADAVLLAQKIAQLFKIKE